MFCFSTPDAGKVLAISPSNASFRPKRAVRSPPEAAPKEEKKTWVGVPVGFSDLEE
jgi:hypothetical protein